MMKSSPINLNASLTNSSLLSSPPPPPTDPLYDLEANSPFPAKPALVSSQFGVNFYLENGLCPLEGFRGHPEKSAQVLLTAEDEESGSSESKFASGISLMSALFPFASAVSSVSSSSKTNTSKGGGGAGGGSSSNSGSKNITFFTTGRAIPQDIVSSIERVGVIPYVKFPVVQSQSFIKKDEENEKQVFSETQPTKPISNQQLASSTMLMRFVPKHQQQSSSQVTDKKEETSTTPPAIDILSLYEEAGAVSRYWFAMAVDAQYGELTDCGGKRESFLEPIERTAARELYEESMGVFDFRKRECEVLNSHAITNGTTCIFFVRVHPSDRYGFPYGLPSLFQKNKKACFSSNSNVNVTDTANTTNTTNTINTNTTTTNSSFGGGDATNHSSGNEGLIFRRGSKTPTTTSTRFRTRYIMTQQNQKRYHPFRPHTNPHTNPHPPPQNLSINRLTSGDFPPPQPNSHSHSQPPHPLQQNANTNAFSQTLLSSSSSSTSSKKAKTSHSAFFENSCMYWVPGNDLEKILEIRTKKVNKKKYHISPIPFTRLPSSSSFSLNSTTTNFLLNISDDAVFNETEIELSKLIQLEKDTGRLPKKKLTLFALPSPSTSSAPQCEEEVADDEKHSIAEPPPTTDAVIPSNAKQDEEVVYSITAANIPTAATTTTTSAPIIIKHPFMYETIRKLILPVWSVFKEKL